MLFRSPIGKVSLNHGERREVFTTKRDSGLFATEEEAYRIFPLKIMNYLEMSYLLSPQRDGQILESISNVAE